METLLTIPKVAKAWKFGSIDNENIETWNVDCASKNIFFRIEGGIELTENVEFDGAAVEGSNNRQQPARK